MITSRRAGRWIIPKGWPIKGLEPFDAAAREAYEEAGIRGVVSEKAFGTYLYKKRDRDRDRRVSFEVTVFPLRVKRQRRKWPERHERKTRWVSLQKAVSLVAEKELRALISDFRDHKRR